MNCIKTGCTVLSKGLLYHGDLFLSDGELILDGVPRNDKYQSFGAESYFTNFDGRKYDCESLYLEFLGSNQQGYGRFSVFGSVTPTEEFYEFIKEWADFSIDYFTKGK